jgi:TPR repeat protein
MQRTLSMLIAAGVLQGCASPDDSALRNGSQERAAPTEPIALSRSLAIDEGRPPGPVMLERIPEDDPLPLKSTELHPDLGIGDKAFREDQVAGLNGDKDAALRVAHMFRQGTHGVPRDERKMVQWLRRASDLSNGSASYELYQYYLGRGLDRAAVRFEKRALEQGYVPPPRLDPRRG